MFQTGSPLLVLDVLEEDDEEVLVVDSSEFEEITLLVLSSTFELVIVLEVRGLLQPDKINAVAARIINRFFFFIALLLYLYTNNKKRPLF